MLWLKVAQKGKKTFQLLQPPNLKSNSICHVQLKLNFNSLS